MQRQTLDSSLIQSAGYDPETQVLEVEFQNGAVYEYQGVSQLLYDGLLLAPSAGKYFYQHVRKGPYPARLVE